MTDQSNIDEAYKRMHDEEPDFSPQQSNDDPLDAFKAGVYLLIDGVILQMTSRHGSKQPLVNQTVATTLLNIVFDESKEYDIKFRKDVVERVNALIEDFHNDL